MNKQLELEFEEKNPERDYIIPRLMNWNRISNLMQETLSISAEDELIRLASSEIIRHIETEYENAVEYNRLYDNRELDAIIRFSQFNSCYSNEENDE